jgi:hypothetical protein
MLIEQRRSYMQEWCFHAKDVKKSSPASQERAWGQSVTLQEKGSKPAEKARGWSQQHPKPSPNNSFGTSFITQSH